MTRRYVFADEAGDFAFQRNQRASKYFILCTISTDSLDLGKSMLDLRKTLVWDRAPLRDGFHATEDRQVVRDRVFEAIAASDLKIFATVLEKSKAQPQTRVTHDRFYQYAWFYHFKGVAKRLAYQAEELLVTTASLGINKQRAAFEGAVTDVLQQYYGNTEAWRLDCSPSLSDPLLQVADYCTWAIQRKWERDDRRSYDIVANKIHHEYDSWRHGKTHYY